MKKKVVIFSLGLMSLMACQKESEIVPDELGTATISGKLTADLDLSNDVNAGGAFVRGLNPEAVEGITVSVTVDTRNWDQTPDLNYNYERRTYTATTDANGEYTLEIPAGERAFNASLSFASFNFDQVQFAANGNGGTRNVQYSVGNRNVSIFAGASESITTKYNEGSVSPGETEVGSYTLNGQLRANNNETNDTNSTGGFQTTYENDFPAGVTLSVQINTNNIGGNGFIYREVTVASDGSFSIQIPTPVDQGSATSFVIQFPDLLMDYTRFVSGDVTTTEELWELSATPVSARNNNIDRLNFTYLLK